MKLITRDYLKTLIDLKGIPDIKVITGIRRSGKSKLLDAFASTLNNKNDNVIRIVLTLNENNSLLNADNLYKFITSKYKVNKNNYVLIDEIQLCEGFEKIIISLHEEEKYDIYITGSNAFLLSSNLATLFGGRTYDLNVFPFSFKEYCKYFNKDKSSFEEYLILGGMSGSYLYKDKEAIKKYVSNVYKTTIVKDIIKKYNIENEELLIMVANYLMDTVGSKTSFRNIANKLSNNYYKTNDKTVGSYVGYLCKSFLFYPIARFDIKGGGYLQTEKKYYLSDLSFRFVELGMKHINYGFLYENLVAIELLRRKYEVYVGVLYNKEVDFVAIKDGKRTYIQVSDDISNEKIFDREVSSLLSIKDSYPKILIARTKHNIDNYKGIEIIDIAEWLKDY